MHLTCYICHSDLSCQPDLLHHFLDILHCNWIPFFFNICLHHMMKVIMTALLVCNVIHDRLGVTNMLTLFSMYDENFKEKYHRTH